jgi:hypothetical protein
MNKFLKVIDFIVDALATERYLIRKHLKLKPRIAFIRPSKLKELTSVVDFSRRYRLEGFCEAYGDVSQNASASAAKEVRSGLAELISEKKRKKMFPVSTLDGAMASKSFSPDHESRRRQLTMADMGALVTDLEGLNGLDSTNKIEACKQHYELRMEDFTVWTDNWYNRFYWANSGGSHHMAVLCNELQKVNLEWHMNATLVKRSFDLSKLEVFNRQYKTYLVPAKRSSLGSSPIESLPYRVDRTYLLGLMSFRVKGDNHYELVVVDTSAKYGSICVDLLEEYVNEGKAMYFHDFITEFMSAA